MEDLPLSRITAYGDSVCSEGPALGQNTDDDNDDDDTEFWGRRLI